MAVLINFKICDNAKECNGIAVCPTHTLYWDEKRKSIGIDNSKCISCGKCEKACMVGAIRVAKNEDEYKKIKREIDEDPRKVSDLFVDRYGAQTIQPAFLIPDGRFDIEVLESNKLTTVEFFNKDSINCLLYSIPIKELFENVDIKYRRLEVKDESLLKKYKVKSLPSLLFFNKGKLIGKIEGYYRIERKNELKEKINKIIKKVI
ncbi:MAG: 4Fe-4S dicluster domain-containing protein [Candidatus Aenigmatarchaeota archaeon]